MANNTEYKATVIISSIGDSGDVALSVEWSPELTGADLVEAGFIPASFAFVQDFIFPALEEAFNESAYAAVEEIEKRQVN